MAARGTYYMANHILLTVPDVVAWSDYVIGDGGDGHQRRSPYKRLVMSKQVALDCINWWQFDGTTLVELVCPPPRSRPGIHERYTDVVCKSVEGKYNAGVLTEVTASFDVMTEV